MAIKEKPVVRTVPMGKIWEHEFNLFKAKVYVPQSDEISKIINFGYDAPCFLLLCNNILDDENTVECAKKLGLEEIAIKYHTSIIFISLTKSTWKDANSDLFIELISNIKIHQYYEDGIAILNNRFFKTNDGFAIRGAIFRTCLIASGSAADYVANNLICSIEGDGLWGKADIAPTVCVLQNLSDVPNICRYDMPIVSIDNTKEINKVIKKEVNYSVIKNTSLNPKNATYYSKESLFNLPELSDVYDTFIKKFIRWGWEGELSIQKDLEEIGLNEEYYVANLKTSKDNCGDDAKTKNHDVGYIAYYKKGLFDKNRTVPLVLCFHGGGDSAKHIAKVSDWKQVCYDGKFLLICVENHINVTATEVIELIEVLKKQFNIDQTRIYSTGFSMGGCKTWDLYQEYPSVFAAMAPMDATFDVGKNIYDNDSVGLNGSGKINSDILVPIFYVGGDVSPLPELPFHAKKCFDRVKYVLKVNDCINQDDSLTYEDKEKWPCCIFAFDKDELKDRYDKQREAFLNIFYYKSKDSRYYTAFSYVYGQGHECRYHSCKCAWEFMSCFARIDGKICFIKKLKL